MNKPEAIVLHHEGNSNGLNAVNNWHKQRGFPQSSLGWYVGYGYYIDLLGNITQTRADTEEQMHTRGGWNQKSIGICLQGNMDISTSSEAQQNALSGLVNKKMVEFGIPLNRVYGHWELWPTACPGQNLKRWVRDFRQSDLSSLQTQINRIRAMLAEMQKSLAKLIK